VPAEKEEPFLVEMSRFFVVPAIIVALCAGIFFLFGLIASDRRSAHEYLEEVRGGSSNRKWQAAFELSRMLTRDPESRRDPTLVPEIVRELSDPGTKDPLVRQYLVLALEQIGDPAGAPAVERALADSDPEVRLYAARALGRIRGEGSVPALVTLLDDQDADLRKMALYSLGQIGDPSAASRIEPRLEDPVEDVRWNAALALAVLGSAAGADTLRRMMDPAYLDRVEGITESQKIEARLNAVQAAFRLREPGLRDAVEAVSRNDTNLKVRDVALKALDEWK
jgi:hypothetical protein